MLMIGERLRALRVGARLTQGKLAVLLSVDKSTISSYECGIRTPPCPILVKYATTFHVSTDYLLGIPQKDTLDLTGLSQDNRVLLMQLIKTLKNEEVQNSLSHQAPLEVVAEEE